MLCEARHACLPVQSAVKAKQPRILDEHKIGMEVFCMERSAVKIVCGNMAYAYKEIQ